MIRELHIINKCNATPMDMLALATKIMPTNRALKSESCKRVKSFTYKGLEANIKYEKKCYYNFSCLKEKKGNSQWNIKSFKEMR